MILLTVVATDGCGLWAFDAGGRDVSGFIPMDQSTELERSWITDKPTEIEMFATPQPLLPFRHRALVKVVEVRQATPAEFAYTFQEYARGAYNHRGR